MKRFLPCIFCLTAAACGSSVGGEDAASDTDVDSSVDMDAAHEIDEEGEAVEDVLPERDGPVGELVMLSCYELEFAVNTEAAEGESILRWYGGFYLADEGTTVTNMSVDSLEFVKDGDTRAMIGAALRYTDPIEELPRVQREVMGTVVLTSGELEACSSGPGLHRVYSGSDKVLVRMQGTSDQGEWAAECEVDGDRVLITCHSGISMHASGSAFVLEDNPEPPPPTWVDIHARVSLDVDTDFEEAQITSLVVHGEGTEETYEGTSIRAVPDYIPTIPPFITIYCQEGGHLGDTLCPDWEIGFPVNLYITYEGTVDGAIPFAGTAPANQCVTGAY